MATITAHCLVKNEENFVGYAIKSVVNFVDQVIVFDTGSTDKTVTIIRQLVKEYPSKIIFEEKGVADKVRHTKLRQEMLDRTITDWFMILDGDEVWTKRAMEEAAQIIAANAGVECLIAPFYLCVGDVYHDSVRGYYNMHGKRTHATPRFFKKTNGIHWQGDYDRDAIVDANGSVIFEKPQVVWLSNSFWHLTHLVRSSLDAMDYSSGSQRINKRRLTYCFSKKIESSIPEVFLTDSVPDYLLPLNIFTSVQNCISLGFKKAVSSKKEILGKLVLLAVSMATTFFLLEIGVRIIEPVDTLPLRVGENGYVLHEKNLDIYRKDDESGKKVHTITNAEGFIGNNLTANKKEGEVKIVVLGDSFVEARQVDYESGFVYLLEKNLNKEFGGTTTKKFKSASVFNFGVGGLSTIDEIKYYHTYIKEYDPDIVVLTLFLGNDIDDNAVYKNTNILESMEKTTNAAIDLHQYKNAGFKNWLFKNLATYRISYKIVKNNNALHVLLLKMGLVNYKAVDSLKIGLANHENIYYYFNPLQPLHKENIAFTAEAINNFAKQLDNEGKAFILLVIHDGYIYKTKIINNIVQDKPAVLQYLDKTALSVNLSDVLDKNMSVIDTFNEYDKIITSDTDLYLRGVGHLNEDGHALTANLLSSFIINHNFK